MIPFSEFDKGESSDTVTHIERTRDGVRVLGALFSAEFLEGLATARKALGPCWIKRDRDMVRFYDYDPENTGTPAWHDTTDAERSMSCVIWLHVRGLVTDSEATKIKKRLRRKDPQP